MSWRRLQDQHIRDAIKKRAEIVRAIRDFFDSRNFLEVQTPRLVRLAGQEPYLDPMTLSIHDARGERYRGYLITSPEYACKKLLAAGFGNIYDLGPCFRDREQFGGLHNPEFIMLEWYRVDADYRALMDDIDALLSHIARVVSHVVRFEPCERLSVSQCFERWCGTSLAELLTNEDMVEWARARGYSIGFADRYEDVFYRVFLNEIEPHLGKDRPMIVYGYPRQMASLARIGEDGYAERCELYIRGVEIANGFSELTDAVEQRQRFEEERRLREMLGKDSFDIDDDFIDAVGVMPRCAGIALGVDRLVMVLLASTHIEEVQCFPASQLFNS